MANTFKSLAQLNPLVTTLTTLYTVPAATSVIVSSLIVCNQGAADATFRLSHAVAAAADSAKQYLAYDVTVPGNGVYVFTVGLTLAATDLLRAYASTATVSFNVYGQEIT